MGKQSTHAPVRSAGVVGMARRKGDAGNGGDPSDRRSRLHRRRWRRIGRESDRGVVPLKPGNSGGGKAPDFWCAFEDSEVKVIGDKPRNTIKGPDPSEIAVSWGEGDKPAEQKTRAARFLRVPHGETSRRAGCRKSARPVR